MLIKKSIRIDCCDFGDLPWHLSMETGAWLTTTFFEFEVEDTTLKPASEDLRTIFQQNDTVPCDDACKQKEHRQNGGPNCIEGILHPCSLEEAQESIHECLSSDSSPQDSSEYCNQIGFLPAPPEEVQRRIKLYWDAIGQFLTLPPRRVYWFENTTGDFFGDLQSFSLTTNKVQESSLTAAQWISPSHLSLLLIGLRYPRWLLSPRLLGKIFYLLS